MSQKQVEETWLPVKSKSNLKQSDGGRVQFCAEQCSTAIVQFMILTHTDCKEMDLCPIRGYIFVKKSLPFLTNLPQSQILFV